MKIRSFRMKYLKVSCYRKYKTTRIKLAILLKIKIFNLLYLNKSSFKYSAQSTRLKTTKKPSEKLNLYCTLYTIYPLPKILLFIVLNRFRGFTGHSI